MPLRPGLTDHGKQGSAETSWLQVHVEEHCTSRGHHSAAILLILN